MHSVVSRHGLRLPLLAAPVSSIDLARLPDLQGDAAYLRAAIKKWLDDEYIEQPVHEKIGQQCGDIYVVTRQRGVTDLGECLLDVGTALERVPFENAFVNAWDVANKVADLLLSRMDNPSNPTSSSAAPALLTAATLTNVIEELPSEFSRYTLLQRLLDRETPLQAVVPIALVCLGFRAVPQGPGLPEVLQQLPEVAAFGWEGLSSPPDFSNLADEALAERIERDLPEDSGGVDVIVEAIAGIEMYAQMQRSTDPDTRRRVLVTKWLYIQNFFGDFPRTRRFIPKHLEYRLEE